MILTKKIRFWDTESNSMVESKQSCVRAFRNIMDMPSPPSFSDCNNKPQVDRYIPNLGIGKTDCNGVEIMEDDIIIFDYSMFRGDDNSNKIRCRVVYDSNEAMFCIEPIDKIEREVVMFPLFGLCDEIKIIGTIYKINP